MQYRDEGHRNLPRLRRQAPEPFLEIHPATATAADIEDEEWVLLETPAGAVTVKAKLNASLDPAVVATQYGWWQECLPLAAPGYDPFGPAGANVNLLIPVRPDQRIGAAPRTAVPSAEARGPGYQRAVSGGHRAVVAWGSARPTPCLSR